MVPPPREGVPLPPVSHILPDTSLSRCCAVLSLPLLSLPFPSPLSRSLASSSMAPCPRCAPLLRVQTMYLYDVRSGLCLDRCRGARDSVITVAWNPRAPQVIAGSSDGGVHFFNPAV